MAPLRAVVHNVGGRRSGRASGADSHQRDRVLRVIVDTHVHVASHDTDRFLLRPLRAGGSEWWRNPVSAEDLLVVMDGQHVDRAVLVHALAAYSYDCSYTVEAARVDTSSASRTRSSQAGLLPLGS
jgi:hypothetical protein